ncbi:YecA family protein [Sporosarcina sp. CAU 1771]
MVGRNDSCPCGSGKKYKKCCALKNEIEVNDIHLEELDRILQGFYEVYPKQKDVPEYMELASKWKKPLLTMLNEELIEAVVLDEFFFHYRNDIWLAYLERTNKRQIRSSIKELLETWQNPRVFIGKVTQVDPAYMTVQSIFGDKTIELKRESEKPVSIGAHLYCFILPDGTLVPNRYLAVSSLIFFPVDHQEVFKNFVKKYDSTSNESIESFWKQNSITFWKDIGTDGYTGSEFTNFEEGVLDFVMDFLEKHEQVSEDLLEFVEDYLVELQPNARKEVAIAAGAIRYGLEKSYIKPLNLTQKELAEWFEVSTSSMNRYYKEMTSYDEALV